MALNDATLLFIENHIRDDIRQLALKKTQADVDKLLALSQIEARQTLSKKVPSWASNPDLLFPKHLSLEQCSSELTAKYKKKIMETHYGASLQPDNHSQHSTFIDLTGGLGVDSYFLSEDFQNAYYVESQSDLCELAENNFRVLGRKTTVVNEEAESFLNEIPCDSCPESSWIFVDPSRRDAFNRKMVSLHDCAPDVVELQGKMLDVAGHVLIKASPMLDISLICNELRSVKEIHVVSVKNECKEILILLERGFAGNITFACANLRQDLHDDFVFAFSENDERDAVPSYASTIKKYLYEPNSSLMKAGVFRLVSQRFNIEKLHVNSHLYTSDNLISDFPGRVFEVIAFSNFDRKVKKGLLKDVTKASVVTRNFPLSTSDLRKNLGLQESDDTFVFGTTMRGDKKVIILCKKHV